MSEGQKLHEEMTHGEQTILHLRDLVCKRADTIKRMEAEIEGVRRFSTGEKPTATTNIAEEIAYGYGDLSDNGFWQYPVPTALVELKRSMVNDTSE